MQLVTMPWGAWRGNRDLFLNFPKDWEIILVSMADGRNLSQAEMRGAFANPLGQEPIRRLAEGKKTAVIAVYDLTRPTQAHRFLPFIVDDLNKSGIKNENIKIDLAMGCHRALMKKDQEKKIGKKMANRFPIKTGWIGDYLPGNPRSD